jgi:hypothetical protein
MRKTKKNTLAAAALVALLLTGCETRMTNPHATSTAALTQRKAYLQERERIDDYGIMYGPTRWISHAIDEKKSRDELRSIDAELEHRHMRPPDLTADISG